MISGAILSVRGGPDNGAPVSLSGEMTTMGRAEQNDVVVELSGVSRQHATIRRDDQGYWITDLDSRNGTYVDGEKVGPEPRRLRNLARIDLGGPDREVYWIFVESQSTMELEGLPPNIRGY